MWWFWCRDRLLKRIDDDGNGQTDCDDNVCQIDQPVVVVVQRRSLMVAMMMVTVTLIVMIRIVVVIRVALLLKPIVTTADDDNDGDIIVTIPTVSPILHAVVETLKTTRWHR